MAEAVGELFDLIDAAATAAVTSELTLAEVLELDRDDIAGAYLELLQPSPGLAVPPVDRAILLAAARLQGQLTLRLPDAIHVSTALAFDCELFVSNDNRLKLRPTLSLLALG